MYFTVVALLGALAAFIACGFSTTYREFTDMNGNTRMRQSKQWRVNKKCLLALLPLLLVLGDCFTSVPAGHTGVLVTFGKVEDVVLSEGVSFKLPYQQVIKMDNRVQKQTFTLEAFSSDIQQTSVMGSINFTVDKTQSQKLYQQVGQSYYDTVIYPRILENVKLVFSGYTAEGLIESRTALSTSVEELVAAEMLPFGIQVVSISIENIDFTDAFTDAVEAKQVAQQNKLTTQTEQESAIIVAESQAEQQLIAAQAEAERQKIAADAEAYAMRVAAEAEAEANLKIAESLTDALLVYTQIQQWNGEVPQVQTGDGDLFPTLSLDGVLQSAQ